jgi:predicted dehydrogenase
MSHRISRRTFVKSIAYAGAAAPLLSPRLLRAASANEKLNHASIGVNGQGWSDLNSFTGPANAPNKINIVALCDIDSARIGDAAKLCPMATRYADWRELLDKKQKNIDSVSVTVPDHMHAPISMSAILLGKHVYCQKPLTHEVYEARQVTLAAKKAGVVTQMGVQIHAAIEYRSAVELIQSGTIGKIKEVHTWSSKDWGGGTNEKAETPPATMNWDHWLGVAPQRHYQGGIHPGNWRRFTAFGTGTFGDMGCHIYDPVFGALALTAPISLTAKGPSPDKEGWPHSANVKYVFPRTPFTAGDTVAVTWYDGGEHAPKEIVDLLEGQGAPDQGSIFIGESGVMLLPHIGGPQFFPREKFREVKRPKLQGDDHYRQFIDACRGERKTTAGFDYSGPLSETVLLGNVASRFPNQTLEWDAANLKVTNISDANQHIRRPYRKGWEVPGL